MGSNRWVWKVGIGEGEPELGPPKRTGEGAPLGDGTVVSIVRTSRVFFSLLRRDMEQGQRNPSSNITSNLPEKKIFVNFLLKHT